MDAGLGEGDEVRGGDKMLGESINTLRTLLSVGMKGSRFTCGVWLWDPAQLQLREEECRSL